MVPDAQLKLELGWRTRKVWNVNVRKCYAAPGQCSDYAGDANGHHRSSEVFHYGILFYAKRVFQA